MSQLLCLQQRSSTQAFGGGAEDTCGRVQNPELRSFGKRESVQVGSYLLRAIYIYIGTHLSTKSPWMIQTSLTIHARPWMRYRWGLKCSYLLHNLCSYSEVTWVNFCRDSRCRVECNLKCAAFNSLPRVPSHTSSFWSYHPQQIPSSHQ